MSYLLRQHENHQYPSSKESYNTQSYRLKISNRSNHYHLLQSRSNLPITDSIQPNQITNQLLTASNYNPSSKNESNANSTTHITNQKLNQNNHKAKRSTDLLSIQPTSSDQIRNSHREREMIDPEGSPIMRE